ncbi:hypothetical protein M8J77_004760 [Diaphorina citri]|nr:hypothetical protein M8J77_004760 [Diaphorina citri]
MGVKFALSASLTISTIAGCWLFPAPLRLGEIILRRRVACHQIEGVFGEGDFILFSARSYETTHLNLTHTESVQENPAGRDSSDGHLSDGHPLDGHPSDGHPVTRPMVTRQMVTHPNHNHVA